MITNEDELEKLIISNAVLNEKYFNQIKDTWKSKYFDDPDYQKAYDFIKSYHKKYNKLPSKETLSIELPDSIEVDYEYLIDQTDELLKDEALKEVVLDIVDIVQKKKDRNEIKSNIDDALNVSIKSDNKPFGMGMNDFNTIDIPERKDLLSPWLKTQSITIVNAKRGIGKTQFVWGIAKAIGEANDFSVWNGSGDKVLILDGEMIPGDLQERNKSHNLHKNVFIRSTIYEDDRKKYPGLLMNASYRNVILNYCIDNQIKLLILDNKKSLCSGIEENSNNAFDLINDWLIDVRGKGISIILVTHSGKNESLGVRGASAIEDNIDYSISLKDCKKESDYCKFSYKFEKVRTQLSYDTIKPRTLEFCPNKNGVHEWLIDTDKEGESDIIIDLHSQGMKQVQISKECGISQAKVSMVLKKHKPIME